MRNEHPALHINGDRLMADLLFTAQFGGTERGGIDRLSLTDTDKRVRDWFADQCSSLGCEMIVDEMGNMFALRAGSNPTLAPIAMGSHLDTQSPGGKFDGVLGVLAGLEVIRRLNELELITTAPIAVVNWTNEEGARFVPAMLGSGVHCGVFTKDFAYARTDRAGNRLGDELAAIGYQGPTELGLTQLGAYFELHIEQGPVLEAEGKQIGVVTGVQAMRHLEIIVEGREGHAGTNPMGLRFDAMRGANLLIDQCYAIAEAANGLATVGMLDISNPARNVVPGKVFFTLDIRHKDDVTLDGIEADIRARAAELAKQRHLTIAANRSWHSPAVHFDKHCIESVRGAVASLGFSSMEMVSGAGHDAVHTAQVTPTTMIFVPSILGISHNEVENTTSSDCVAGADILFNAVLSYDRSAAQIFEENQ